MVGERGTDSLSLWAVRGAGCVSRVSEVSGMKIHRQLKKHIEGLKSKLAGKGNRLG